MDTPLILILILAFAFAMTHLERYVLGERVTLLSGIEYVLLGVLCGPLVLELFDKQSLDALEPLLSVVTGFIGFIYGLPVTRRSQDIRGARRFGMFVALFVAAVIGIAAWVAFSRLAVFSHVSFAERLVASLTLGFAAAASSVESIVSSITSTRSRGPISDLLPRIAATTRVIAIIGFGLAIAADRQNHFLRGLDLPWWVGDLAEIAAGALCGLIFHVFVRDESNTERLFVAVIGVIMLASGIAYALEMSPLLVCLISGVTVANLSPTALRLTVAVSRLGRPFKAVLLLIAGATWRPIPGSLWIFVGLFVFGRVLALHAATWLGSRRNPTIDPHTPWLGNALLSQGALVAAIAVNYELVPVHSLQDIVVTCLLVSAVLNEVWATWATRRVLQLAGETGRRPPEERHDANHKAALAQAATVGELDREAAH